MDNLRLKKGKLFRGKRDTDIYLRIGTQQIEIDDDDLLSAFEN